MAAKPKILLICDAAADAECMRAQLGDAYEVAVEPDSQRAVELLAREAFAGVFLCTASLRQLLQLGSLIRNEQIVQNLPDGVVLLDADLNILWSNGRLCEWSGRPQCVGENFYKMLGGPEILGPDFCPFRTALATGQHSNSCLRATDNTYYEVHAAPIREGDEPPRQLIVTVRDVTDEVHQRQKLTAIHRAGAELADLKPDELIRLTGKERSELLKENILHFTKDLLNYEVVEIRLLDQKTLKLIPLLEMGMEPESAQRELFALPQGNGVTGFVAATGKSYLCEDTAEDPLYLEGARGAKSSLTVPLLMHNEVIGTFNVESREPRAFSEGDLQFLEIFGRDVAVALNTLDLLMAEKGHTAAQAVEVIHSAVALPIDEILIEAINVMERYIGHEPDVVERLQKILRNARDIKQLIQKVGQKMAPAEALPEAAQLDQHPVLHGRRILVVDPDETVRRASHDLLERYSCIVETVHCGMAALAAVRAEGPGSYDVLLSEKQLPDFNAHQLLLRLREQSRPPAMVLMTGFGWDKDHILVKCRQSGLPANAVLYKPFRLDQLLKVVEENVGRGLPPVPPETAEK